MNYNLDKENLFYTMALIDTLQVGDQSFRILVQEFGSPKAVFETPLQKLEKIANIGTIRAKALKAPIDEAKIQKEIDFIERNNINVHYCFDDSYPKSLKQIPDAPILLFSKGNMDLHHPRKIAIVGTRKLTEYGKSITQELIKELKAYQVQIISGMAYGIDIVAHKQSVQEEMSTIGILAHGLDRLYPSIHQSTAKVMMKNGGLLTEYPSGTKPDRFNFPMRNRIVAGISDMTIIVESKAKGGALITAKLAAAYNREVGAIPGKINDEKSAGCNYLIKRNIAHLIENVNDIVDIMNWDQGAKKAAQSRLFLELTQEEQTVMDFLAEKENMHVDELMLKSGMNYSKLAAILLNLELMNAVKSLSGKRYSVC